MSENKLTKLPPHLQEKMTDAAYSYEVPRHFNCYGCCQSDSDYEKSFESGYLQAYSDLMQELGPVVEVLERISCICPYICCCGYDESQRALKHLKERILNEKT